MMKTQTIIVVVLATSLCSLARGQEEESGGLGEINIKGEESNVGRRGAPGIDGAPGRRGRKGEVGEMGAVGEQGIQGLPGVKGEAGKCVKRKPQPCVCDGMEALLERIESLESEMRKMRRVKTTTPSPTTRVVVATVSKFSVEADADGWITIQQRTNGNVDFFRNWEEYEDGFGTNENFWVGLKTINRLTKKRNMMLRIEFEDRLGKTAYEEYATFVVADASLKYRLEISAPSGTAGDSFSQSNKKRFSTWDSDYDASKRHCARDIMHGGWWYIDCGLSNLNGDYMVKHGVKAMYWFAWRDTNGLKTVVMKIRPKVTLQR